MAESERECNIHCTKQPHEACEDCTLSNVVTFDSKVLDMSMKVLQIGKTYTNWTFTDGKTVFTRTNPWHTHQGRYQLGTFKGFGNPEFPDFITNAFGAENVERAHLIENADEGEMGYIHLPPSMQEKPLIKGMDKSGRPLRRDEKSGLFVSGWVKVRIKKKDQDPPIPSSTKPHPARDTPPSRCRFRVCTSIQSLPQIGATWMHYASPANVPMRNFTS